MSNQEAQRVSRTITNLLNDHQSFRMKVDEVYNELHKGKPGLDIPGLALFIHRISVKLGVPSKAFGAIEDEFARFDFSGDGFLQENETYRLVKYHIKTYRKVLGFEIDDVEIPRTTPNEKGLTIVKELAHGNQGTVKLAVDAAGAQVCLKIMTKENMDNRKLEQLKDEFEMMYLLHHEGIARTFDIFQDASSYYLVNQPYFGVDLTGIVSKAQECKVSMTEAWWRKIFWQCFDALSYMHQHAVMHCDIKEANIMVKRADYHNPQIVIIDLGLAQECVFEVTSIVGTPGYMPPETLRTHKWYPKGDCFSMGVVMVQLFIDWIPMTPSMTLDGKPRFGLFTAGVHSDLEVVNATMTRPLPTHWLPQIPTLIHLVVSLADKDINRRPTAYQAKEHKWFASTSVGGPVYDPVQMREARKAK